MATYWVDDAGDNANTGTAYTAPKASLMDNGNNSTGTGALSASSAGDRIYVLSTSGDQYEEKNSSGARYTADLTISNLLNREIIAVDSFNAGDPDVVATTRALISMGSGSYDLNILEGSYWSGWEFSSDAEIDSGDASWDIHFYDCKFDLRGSNSKIFHSTSATSIIFKECEIDSQSSLATIATSSQQVRYLGCSITATGSAENNLFDINGDHCNLYIQGGDYSLVNPSNAIFDTISASFTNVQATMVGCKIHASASIMETTMAPGGYVLLDESQSGDIPRKEFYIYGGDIKIDTGVYLSGGWTEDPDSDALSYKYAANSNTDHNNPLGPTQLGSSMFFGAYLDSTGSTTFTVEAVHDFSSLTIGDAWMELYYKSETSQSWVKLDSTLDLLSETALTSSSKGAGDWTGEPVSPTFVKFETTVTVNRKGMYYVGIFLAKSTGSGEVLYVDPIVTTS